MREEQKTALVRFLRSRSTTNKMAGVIANMIRENRSVDAVAVPEQYRDHMLGLFQQIEFDHVLFRIGDDLILCYPHEDREKYMDIREEILSEGPRPVYAGFDYSDMRSAVDMMKAIPLNYRVSKQGEFHFSISVANREEEEMQQIIDMVQSENHSPEGEKIRIYQNALFEHAVNQIATAMAIQGTVLMGSEHGQAYMVLEQDGATVVDINGRKEFISRSKNDFEKEIMKKALTTLKCDMFPLKECHGDLAISLSKRMSNMSLKNALNEMQLTEIPHISELDGVWEKSGNRNPEAFGVVQRAAYFHSQIIDNLEVVHPSDKSFERYRDLHQRNVEAARNFSVSREERSYGEERIT